MSDRDLRALDMRHTLPNLKNLLLTLTDGEGVSLRYVISVRGTDSRDRPLMRPSRSPMSLVSDLDSTSSRADSPVEPDSSTPKVTSITDLPAESNTPPASGSTTPTAATTDTSKKARPFLGFSPFTGFLLGRYPSPGRTLGKSPPSISENGQELDGERTSSILSSGEQDGSDEEDRKTIHGVTRDVDLEPREQGKPQDDAAVSLENGVAPKSEQEKLQAGNDSYSPSHTILSVPFPHIK